MSCILDQSVWSKMQLVLICAMNKDFIWSLCSAAFIGVLRRCALHRLLSMGRVYGFLFTAPCITNLASFSTHTLTYPQTISPSSCLWIHALLCSDLTKLLDNTEIHCCISAFSSQTSPLVTNLNFTILSRDHILLKKAWFPHRLQVGVIIWF